MTDFAHPLLKVGADLRSLTRKYGDTEKPLGGAYLSTEADEETGAIEYVVVDTHRGRPEWHRLDEAEVDWSQYTGLIRRDVVYGRLAIIAGEIAKGNGQNRHIGALVRLQSVLR